MKVNFSKNIFKDFDKIKDELLEKINLFVQALENINDISELSKYDIKKLKWYKIYYRIRFWDFRLWFKVLENEIVLITIKHRKDIYKIFP